MDGLVTLARQPLLEAPEPPRPQPALSPLRTCWALERRGEDPATAAELTAYIFGLPPMAEGEVLGWTVPQINALLFLRELARRGTFGQAVDGGPTPAWYLAGRR